MQSSTVTHRINRHGLEQLQTGHEQRKGGDFPDRSPPLAVEQRQPQRRAITSQDAQTLPAGKTNGRLDEAQKLRIERIEDGRKKMRARFRERCRRDHATQARLLAQQGEEAIEFCLDGATHAGEQERDQVREGEAAVAGEKARFAPRRLEEGRGVDEVCQTGKYVDIFRPSYIILINQCVTTHHKPMMTPCKG